MGSNKEKLAHTEYWLQRWIAIAQSIGIDKNTLFCEYYFDEFLAMLDEYNDMHKIITEDAGIEEVSAEDW